MDCGKKQQLYEGVVSDTCHGKDGDYLKKLHAARDTKCNSVCRMQWELHRELGECPVRAKLMGAENEGD